MRPLIFLPLAAMLLAGCLTQPAPWAPDGLAGNDAGEPGADVDADVLAEMEDAGPEQEVAEVAAKDVAQAADGVEPACLVALCPELSGYDVACNARQHCEYHPHDASGHRQWDVWIYIPPGSFKMGSEGEGGGGDEMPVHLVTMDYGYFISKYEVVVTQYEACHAEQPDKCSVPSTVDWDGSGWGTNSSAKYRPDHPQNGLTWQQSKDFCAWVAPNGRLPSEAEWEYAAAGPEHLKYPWGVEPEPTCANNTAVMAGDGQYGCGGGGTWPVGSKLAGAAWCGALDMGGNLWEWTGDWYHSTYAYAPADGSAWVEPPGSTRPARGGSFDNPATSMRSASRYDDSPSTRDAGLGARCLRPMP